jgi:hypothetical protein
MELSKIVSNQLEPGENLLWTGQPDAGALTTKLLLGCTLMLGAIFAESVSLVANATTDVEQIIAARIVGLCFFTAVGAFILWRVPARAALTVYAVTNRRVLKLDLNRRVPTNTLDKIKHLKQTIIYERKNLKEGFWFSLAANSFLFSAWFALFLPAAIESCDLFIAMSALLFVAAIALYIYDRHYLPDARWREAGGVLYWIDGKLVYLQDVRLKDIHDVKVRRTRRGINDLFVVTRTNGCLRLPSIGCPDGPRQLLTTFGAIEGTANAG